jgi:hypothetical protein
VIGGAVVIGLLVVALSGCGASDSRPASTSRGTPVDYPRCMLRDLRLSAAGAISPGTDEAGVELKLVNASARACILGVSPARVALEDHGRRLPFAYSLGIPRGGELDVATRRLRPALLLPATAGYFSVTKAECVARFGAAVTEIRVVLPGSATPLTAALPSSRGVEVLSYCLPEADAHGQTSGDGVRVTPIMRRPPACIREAEVRRESEREVEREGRECEAEDEATAESYRTPGGAPGARPAWEVQ